MPLALLGLKECRRRDAVVGSREKRTTLRKILKAHFLPAGAIWCHWHMVECILQTYLDYPGLGDPPLAQQLQGFILAHMPLTRGIEVGR